MNVGFPGKVNDAGVLQASGLWDLLNSGVPSEYHIIGDGAFPLHRNLMKPFRGETTPEQENFNYRCVMMIYSRDTFEKMPHN